MSQSAQLTCFSVVFAIQIASIVLFIRMRTRLHGLEQFICTLERSVGRSPRGSASLSEKSDRTDSEKSASVHHSGHDSRLRMDEGLSSKPFANVEFLGTKPKRTPISKLISVPQLAWAASSDRAAEAGGELTRKYSSIWTLAERGLSLEEIARESGLPIGQVDLIIGLKRGLATSGEY